MEICKLQALHWDSTTQGPYAPPRQWSAPEPSRQSTVAEMVPLASTALETTKPSTSSAPEDPRVSQPQESLPHDAQPQDLPSIE